MNIKSYMDKVNSIVRNDESLLRLLYYKSKTSSDDPLDTSKPNILDMPIKERMELINHRIKFTPVTSDLVKEPICRLFFYPARRNARNYNFQVSTQQIKFDVFVHQEYNDTDMRLAKICDYLNDLLQNSGLSNLGETRFHTAQEMIYADIGYIAYSMTYEFGSLN